MKKLKKMIIKTHAFNLVTARLHQRTRRKELQNICRNTKKKCITKEHQDINDKYSKYIWICWWQGEAEMPPLVKECYNRIKMFNIDKKVILITEKNFHDYVEFPIYMIEKYKSGIITKTHFSDLLRTELLLKYGGVWMDATLFTFSKVPSDFYQLEVYTGRYPYDKYDYNVSKNRWTSYFWVSRYPENILFRFLSEFWKEYWKDYNELIEYLLIDYVIDLGVRYIPDIKKELKAIPMNGCGENPWSMLNVLFKEYDETVFRNIKSKNWMQKLSFKLRIEEQNITSESFYRHLFNK